VKSGICRSEKLELLSGFYSAAACRFPVFARRSLEAVDRLVQTVCGFPEDAITVALTNPVERFGDRLLKLIQLDDVDQLAVTFLADRREIPTLVKKIG
jgi:hypothetical protein